VEPLGQPKWRSIMRWRMLVILGAQCPRHSFDGPRGSGTLVPRWRSTRSSEDRPGVRPARNGGRAAGPWRPAAGVPGRPRCCLSVSRMSMRAGNLVPRPSQVPALSSTAPSPRLHPRRSAEIRIVSDATARRGSRIGIDCVPTNTGVLSPLHELLQSMSVRPSRSDARDLAPRPRGDVSDL
jgi:hypothetical protein